MTGNTGFAQSSDASAAPDQGAAVTEAAQDYTDSVVPASERRSNFRMFLTFLSMQATFGPHTSATRRVSRD
jgi:hypothetical protein